MQKNMMRVTRIQLRPGVFARPKGALMVRRPPAVECECLVGTIPGETRLQQATLRGVACWLVTILVNGQVQRQHILPLNACRPEEWVQ